MELTDDRREAAHHLLWIWRQYGQSRETDGVLFLEHRNMTAGENAADWLEDLGLGEDVGYEFMVNELGRQIMNEEFIWSD